MIQFSKLKILLVLICIFFLSCGSVQKNDNAQMTQCFLQTETFEESRMREYLPETQEDRVIADKFLKDVSPVSFMSIVNDEVLYASLVDNEWKVIRNEDEYIVRDGGLEIMLQQYLTLEAVYKHECPDNFANFGNYVFQAFWVKSNGKIKFLYYSTMYDIHTLYETDRSKVSSLIQVYNSLNKS